MFTLKLTNQFKTDAKKAIKRASQNLDLIEAFFGIEKKHLAHKLAGNYKGNWEAHIKPDLLIIWFEITEDYDPLVKVRHSF